MTRSQRVALLLAALGIIAATSGIGARQSQAPAAAPKFGTATSGVLLDVVVRDKKGPVMDLTQDEFTVMEDGKPQQIVSFGRFVFFAHPDQRNQVCQDSRRGQRGNRREPFGRRCRRASLVG